MPDLELINGSDGVGEAVRASVTNLRTAGSTTIQVDAVTNWPAKFIATAGSLLSDGTLDPSTALVFEGSLDGSDISIDAIAPGYTDQGNTVSDIVVIKPATHWSDNLQDLLTVTLDTDGTLKTDAVDVTAVLADEVVTGAKITATDGLLRNAYYYTYDGTDIFINGVDQNNASNAITWTKPSGLKFIEVEVQAGGGGVGLAGSTVGGEASEASGGGGGEYAKIKIAAASLGSTETVTVGAGGAAGTSTNNGGTGGTSSLGTLVTAVGGSGGQYMAGASGSLYNLGGLGGSGGTGTANLRIRGDDGGAASVSGGTTFGYGRKSFGGGSHLGSSVFPTGSASESNSVVGRAYGGGAAGGRNPASTSAKAGQIGGAGIVIIKEYF